MCLSKKGSSVTDERPSRTPFGVYKNPALKRFPQFRIFPSMERVTGSRGRGLVQHGMVQLTFRKGAVHKYAVCKIAALKNFPGKRQASKPFPFTNNVPSCNSPISAVLPAEQCSPPAPPEIPSCRSQYTMISLCGKDTRKQKWPRRACCSSPGPLYVRV